MKYQITLSSNIHNKIGPVQSGIRPAYIMARALVDDGETYRAYVWRGTKMVLTVGKVGYTCEDRKTQLEMIAAERD